MPICPNCGSWVDDGDICMNCGGGVGYGSSDYYDSPPSYNYSPPRYETPEEREERYRRAEERRKEIQKKREKEKRQKEREIREKELEKRRKEANYRHAALQAEFRKRKKREECKKNPECVKEEIESSKNRILGIYRTLLRFEYFQEKSDIRFRKINVYEGLLEKLGVKENYTKKDIRELKKENRRYRDILLRSDAKYRSNGSVLYLKNRMRIEEFERLHPEKGLIKGLFNEVFKSDEFDAFDAEIAVRDRIQRADYLLSDNSENVRVNLHEANILINNAKEELSGYLKEYSFPDLDELNHEMENLEIKFNSKIRRYIHTNRKDLFLMDMCDNQFNGYPGMELELVNEDDSEVIKVFYENNPVGTVPGRYSENFEKHYLDAPELQFLPKSSAAE